MGNFKNWISNSFLAKLYKKSKLLCVAVILFFAGSIFANILKLETTPFFIWNMYGNPVQDKQNYELLLIQYNDSAILNFSHTWKEPQKICLTGTIFTYLQYRENTNSDKYRNYMETYWAAKHPSSKWLLPYLVNDDKSFEAFPAWYKKYLGSIVNTEIHNVSIIKKQVLFSTDGSLKEISSETIKLIQ